MNIQKLLPSHLLSKAYIFNNEYAWSAEDVQELTNFLKEEKISVLGGEVWLKSANAPIIPSPNIYQWTSPEKKENEIWDQYVADTLSEMSKFVKNLQKEKELVDHWSNLYINIVMVDEGEYITTSKSRN